LAQQQGEFESAIVHFKRSLQDDYERPIQAMFALVQCHVAVGNVTYAREALQQAASQDDSKVYTALIDYWDFEVSLNENKTPEQLRSIRDKVSLPEIPRASREFLLGMDASNTLKAEEHFKLALKSDPRHHSAQRSLLVVQLALAKFETVIQESRLAQRLYTNDEDFLLIEALATAGMGDIARSDALLSRTRIAEAELAIWARLIERIGFVSTKLNNEYTREMFSLEHVDSLASEFHSDFLPLFKKRRWHFPPSISKHFDDFPNFASFGDDLELALNVSKNIAETLPESSLLTLAARVQLTKNKLEVSDLEIALDLFQQAIEHNGYVFDAHHYATLGIFSTAVQLALIKKHNVSENTKIFVNAISNVEPSSIEQPNRLRAITKSLLNVEQWELAENWAERWAQLEDRSPEFRWDALWHYGVILERKGRWLDVVRICNQLLEIDPDKEIAKHLRESATGKIKELIAQFANPE